MGLDNGFVLHDTKREDIKFAWYVELPFEEDYDGRVDICYWRKYWDIRGRILNILDHGKNSEQYEYKVEEDDIPAIVRELEKFLNADYFEDYCDNIWDYEDALPHMQQQIKNLLWLREYLIEHPDANCTFYDSY